MRAAQHGHGSTGRRCGSSRSPNAASRRRPSTAPRGPTTAPSLPRAGGSSLDRRRARRARAQDEPPCGAQRAQPHADRRRARVHQLARHAPQIALRAADLDREADRGRRADGDPRRARRAGAACGGTAARASARAATASRRPARRRAAAARPRGSSAAPTRPGSVTTRSRIAPQSSSAPSAATWMPSLCAQASRAPSGENVGLVERVGVRGLERELAAERRRAAGRGRDEQPQHDAARRAVLVGRVVLEHGDPRPVARRRGARSRWPTPRRRRRTTAGRCRRRRRPCRARPARAPRR